MLTKVGRKRKQIPFEIFDYNIAEISFYTISSEQYWKTLVANSLI